MSREDIRESKGRPEEKGCSDVGLKKYQGRAIVVSSPALWVRGVISGQIQEADNWRWARQSGPLEFKVGNATGRIKGERLLAWVKKQLSFCALSVGVEACDFAGGGGEQKEAERKQIGSCVWKGPAALAMR